MTAATPSTLVFSSRRISGSASVTIDASARAMPAATASTTARGVTMARLRRNRLECPVEGPEQGLVSHVEEQAVLDHADHSLEPNGELVEVARPRQRAIHDHVALVGDER